MKASYNAITRLVHWLTAVIVVATFILGPEDLDDAENLGGD
jgi:cytochrome b561